MDDPPASDAWDDAVRAPEGLVTGGSGSLVARLEAWLADARVEGSADARARERWLSAAVDADATFGGVLLDLAERGTRITLATVSGRRLQGVVQVLGADFVALRGTTGSEVLVAMRAIASVRTAPTVERAAGERVTTTDLRLGDVLGELAADRTRVRLVVLDGTEAVSGELRSVGQDVVTVRTDGEAPGMAYVPLSRLAEVVLG